MKKTLYFLFIVSLAFFIALANAQDTTPEEYVVKKGDTLWDISHTIFQDSFLWPNIWRVNPQIKNPDLIFPGDRIRLPSREELMRMVATPEEKIPVIAEPVAIPEEKPVVKVSKPLVNKNLFVTCGWISDEIPGVGKIVNAPYGRRIFGRDDLVYLKTDKSVTAGDKFFVIRDIKKVKHPVSGDSLGHQIRIMGTLEVVGMDSGVPKAKITNAFEDIMRGDVLMNYGKIEPPVAPETISTPDIKGYIAETCMNSLMVAKGDIVYLDKGENDNIKVGDIFSAITTIPVERSIGTLQVIALQPTTSMAIILKSKQEIQIGDVWGKK